MSTSKPESNDVVKTISVIIKTNKGTFFVALSDSDKKKIYKEILDTGKIVIINKDISEKIKFL